MSTISKSRLHAALTAAALLIALVVAACLRLTDLESRPMHVDEAIQAAKMVDTVATGAFVYDPTDYHGPGLIFSTIALRTLTGQPLTADLTATGLRIVPALYGLLLIGALALFSVGLGRAATATAALLLAVSPIFVYYSRYFIMEVPLVAFTALFFGFGWRYFRSGKVVWALASGAAAGLMHVTKETAAISWLATGAALAYLAIAHFTSRPGSPFKIRPLHYLYAVLAGLLVSAILYSSFFQSPTAVLDSFRTYFLYAERAGDAGHEAPWHEYLTLLTYRKDVLIWSEAPIVLLGLAGIFAAFADSKRTLPKFLAIYTLVTFFIYSIIPYKTPWSILPAYFGLVLLAGYGAVALYRLFPSQKFAIPLAAAFSIATLWWFSVQNSRANGRFAADIRNPYVYSHTSGDLVKLADLILTLARLHPDGPNMPVKIFAAPDAGWPLPWYLRGLPKVEYSPDLPGSASGASVFVVGLGPDQINTSILSVLFPNSYHSSHYGFRPGPGNQAILYVEPTLWQSFLNSPKK